MAENRAGPPKMTPTSRHILTTEPDEVVELPPPDLHSIPDGRSAVPRLSLGTTPQMPFKPDRFIEIITKANWSPLILCDANLFIARTDPSIWNALFIRRIGLVPPVLHELASWLASPTNNIFVRDRVVKMLNHEPGPPFELVQFDSNDPIIRTSIEYYVNLLGIRKRLFGLLEYQFEQTHGRPPSPAEVESLAKRFFGERGYQRGKKGREGEKAGQPFADEVLVVTAFLQALAFGQEVLILTRDSDLQEQFYKMQWLLDTHYRSMLLAEWYANDPGAFAAVPMPRDDERVRDAFVGEDNLLLRRTGWTPYAVLPKDFTAVNIYCWLLKGEGPHATITATSFCAERNMLEVFRIKGTTGGLNTDRLDGRNLHIWLSPLPFEAGQWVGVVRDNRVDIKSARIPLLDLQHALCTAERFRHVVVAQGGENPVHAG
jgi:hypothetical protein